MRLISGKWKGKQINAPKHLPVRPTTSFAKEGLFNILHHRYGIADAKVLDLFAGIGSISFEFVSRGAAQVVAVDKSRECINFIEQTAQTLVGVDQQFQSISMDVMSFLDKNSSEKSFDFIFADPPFNTNSDYYNSLMNKVLDSNILAEDGLFILEHSSEIKLDENPRLVDYKKYSQVGFSFFQ